MGRYHVDVEQRSAASPEQVWALLADVTTWSAWGPWDETTLAQQGSPPPEGPGAIRHLRRGRRVSVEVVVVADPARRLSYRLLAGLPIRNYLAEVTLEQRAGGTLIRWFSTFDSGRPLSGAIMQPLLRLFIRRVARQLARAAEGVPVGASTPRTRAG